MSTSKSHERYVVSALLARAEAGDEAAWGSLLERDKERLLRSVRLRMDVRLQRRIDPMDVLQEAFLEASKRRCEFFELHQMPFFVWLRLITLQKLAELHRHHIGTKARDARRDLSLFDRMPPATSAVLAANLLGQTTTPSQIAAEVELEGKVRAILDGMDEHDHEIIALRNFEQLSNVEAAAVLNILPSTASSRYLRALEKLKQALQSLGIEEV